jgi:hypothetical protein
MRVAEFLELIDELLVDEQYRWAGRTLRGIRDAVETSRNVTTGQEQAVENIRASVDRKREQLPSERRAGSRRYEGY